MVRLLQLLISIWTIVACGIPVQATMVQIRTPPLPRLNPSPRMPIITDLYDNTPHGEGLKTAWGFSCLVKGERTVLFDTGGGGRLLLSNLKKLGLAPQEIDAVMVSHLHEDHLGGLRRFLKENRSAVVYLPRSFPESLRRDLEQHGSRTVSVGGPTEICPGFFSTGELGTAPPEQALVVRTARGLVIVTGCAHPGLERVVRTAKESFGGEVLLVLGGFHLAGRSEPEIAAVIDRLKKLGVRHVAPCHCTGDAARRLFKRAFGSGFHEMGVGRVLDTQGLR